MVSEVWAPMPAYPGYEVSSLGRVRSIRREVIERNTGRRRIQKGRVLSQKRLLKGYPSVVMSIDNVKFDRCVHTLVAETFVGPKDGQVRHLDGNPFNNSPDNLAWGTAKQNAEDRDRHGRTARGKRHPQAALIAEGKVTW